MIVRLYDRIGRDIITPFRRGYLGPWLSGYALVGLVVSGIVPVLLPLSADPHGMFAVGLVVTAFYLGMLIAPLFGSLADRTGTQRWVFLGSFPVTAAGAILFGFADQTWQMFLCIFVVGAGAGAAQTTASMFIVEGRPRNQWDTRMGWMRLAFGAGQVLGLAVSAYFSHRLETGWIVVGVIMVIGTGLGWIKLPHLTRTRSDTAPAAPRKPRRRHSSLKPLFASRFGVFLGCWFFAMLGLMTFYNVVPLVLRDSFGVDPRTTSIVFLVGSAIGAILYPACGELAWRHGPARLLAVGIAATLVAFLVLALATLNHGTLGAALGGICLIVIASFYPFQYIGATLLAARLAPGGQGAAMGLFNSGVAAGAIIGAIVPSFLAQQAGYSSLTWFSFAAMIVSVCFGLPLLHALRRDRAAAAG